MEFLRHFACFGWALVPQAPSQSSLAGGGGKQMWHSELPASPPQGFERRCACSSQGWSWVLGIMSADRSFSAPRRDWHPHGFSLPCSLYSLPCPVCPARVAEGLQPGGPTARRRCHSGAGSRRWLVCLGVLRGRGSDSQVLVVAGQEIRLPSVLSFSLYGSLYFIQR